MTTFEGSWIEDLNSTNGVFVRGKRVRRHRLAPGDAVRIGHHELTYFRSEPRAEATDGPETEHDEDEEDAEAAETRDA